MTGFFVRKPVTLCMVLVACLLFGVLTLLRLELAFSPDTGKPGLTVLVRYPGTSAAKIDTLITKKVEAAVSRVPGVSRIFSISSQGKSKVHLIYPYGTSLDIATMDILDALAPVGAAFPRDVEKPVVLRYDPSDSPVFSVAISGENLPQFRRFAEKKLKPRFERVKGVSEVIVAGGEMKEVLVAVDRYKAASRGISLLTVVRSLQFANTEVPGGVLPGVSRELLTKTIGRFDNLNQVSSVRVGGKDSAIFLSDVAMVRRNGKPRENCSLSRGKEQVAIYVKKGGKASLVSVTKQLRAIFEKTKLPKGAKGEIILDSSVFLVNAINRLVEAGIYAAIIAALVLFLFLQRFSSTAVIAMSIPLSVSVTFAVIGMLGMKLDVMTLSGLAVGAGMMVDNSVVVLESIHIASKDNCSPFEAALSGTSRVGMAVFASTLTTASVFLPVIFLSARMRLLFGNLAASISISLFASLFISLSAVPVLAALLLNKEKRRAKKNDVARIDKLLSLPRRILPSVKNIFTRLLNLSLRKPFLPIVVLAILTVGAIIVMPSMGQEIMAPLESDVVTAFVEFPSGTNLKHTEKVAAEVSSLIRRYAFVKKTDTRVEKGHAVVTVKLRNQSGDPNSDKILDILTKRFKKYRKAFVHCSSGSGNAGGGKRSVSIDVAGDDLLLLQKWARKGASVVSRLPGMREVVLLFKEGTPIIKVNINKDKAALYGMTCRDIGLEVRSAIYGPIATKYIENNREVDVRVRFQGGNKISPDKLRSLPITVGDNKSVPLRALASFSRGRSSGRIYRKNGRLTAGFSVSFSGIDMGSAIERIMQSLRRLSPPKGVRFQPGQEAEELKNANLSGVFAVLVAVILIFMVLASMYESLRLPFAIIFSIPAAIASAILVLFFSGVSLSVPIYLGLILLAGLVVNNAIILVDDAKKLIGDGFSVSEAAYNAVERRLRPLMITTLTTVLGMIPMLLSSGEGSGLYRPLALTVLSGMVFSTIVSLFLVPALFTLLYGKRV